jgi:transcription antitermination factor NusG
MNAKTGYTDTACLMDGTSTEWFAIETKYRFEKKVAAQLNLKGFQVFLPVSTEYHQWTDRLKAITVPLFPGYAFVHLDQTRDSCQAVLRTPGLIRFVCFGGVAATVPRKQVEDLQMLMQQKSSFAEHPFLQTGERVRIRGGCLHGLEGILVKRGNDKLVISIQSIHRSLAIEVQGFEMERM